MLARGNVLSSGFKLSQAYISAKLTKDVFIKLEMLESMYNFRGLLEMVV